MVTYRLIGKGTTDSNGVAHMTKATSDGGSTWTDTTGYTGVGAGEIDVVASTDNPMSASSCQSEPYEVVDCIFYDDGIVNPNNKWDILHISKSVESNGTKFLVTETTASSRASTNPVDNASAYDYQPQPMVFEFDVVDLYLPTGGNISAQFIQQNPVLNKAIPIQTSDIGHTIQIRYDGTEIRLYKDGSATERYLDCTFDQIMRVGFSCYTKDSYVIVKNVKTYPI